MRIPSPRVLIGLAALVIIAAAAAVAAVFVVRGPDPQQTVKEAINSGNGYLKVGKLPEASVEFRRAIQADPRSGDARVLLAETLVSSGDLANGLKEYIRAADLLSDRAEVQVRVG